MMQNILLYRERSKLLRPFVEQVILNLTHKCFFRCKMCSSWKTKENEILTLEDYTRLFAGLAKINGPDTLVQITGGEPLSHKYVYEIIRLGKENNLKIGLNTNGFLVDKKVAKKIVDSGLDILVFSLDGSNSEIHDKIRGVPGSFDRVIRGIKLVKAYAHSANKDIAITINTVISALNLHDILNIVELIHSSKEISNLWFQVVTAPLYEEGVSGDSMIDPKDGTLKKWYHIETYSSLWPADNDLLLDVYTKLCALKKIRSKISTNKDRLMMQYSYFAHPEKRIPNYICTMFKDIAIEINGDIFHCPVKNEAIGNIRTEKIENIWNSYSDLRFKRKVINCERHCHVLLNCGLPKDEREKNKW